MRRAKVELHQAVRELQTNAQNYEAAMKKTRIENRTILAENKRLKSLLLKAAHGKITKQEILAHHASLFIPTIVSEKLALTIKEMHFDTRSMDGLYQGEIYTLEDLLRYTQQHGLKGILKCPQIGPTSYKNILSVLREKGLLDENDECYLYHYL